MSLRILALLAVVLLAGCGKASSDNPAPPRSNSAIELTPEPSLVAMPIEADLSPLFAALEREVPRTLWTIDRPGMECVSPQRVRVAGIKIKTPRIKCHVVGRVTRGKLTIAGRGRDLVATMPIHAEVEARDIAGILKRETATADANVRAVARLRLNPDWSLGGTIDIEYDWTREPTIDFLGQKIVLTSKADEKLQRVVRQFERTLPRELAKVSVKRDVEKYWAEGFTVLELNRENPDVWLRLTPQEVGYGGYTLRGKRITVDLGLRATALTFVGTKPDAPAATPLPPPGKLEGRAGRFAFRLPVIADYATLEPVIARALAKRQDRPFEVKAIGPVEAKFGKVTVYGTEGGKVAVGVEFSAQDTRKRFDPTKGTIWMTGRPVNEANSREVRIADFDLAGKTDSTVVNLLAGLAATPDFKDTVAAALTQNFSRDFDELLRKVRLAVGERREGNLVVTSTIDKVETGEIVAAGRGLFLPVLAEGTSQARLVGP